MIGIYCIKNKINNKVYIGSSNNIERRFRKHKTELNTKTHSNKYLTRAYIKYNKENFEFIILELCNLEDLIDREIYYISKYDSLNEKKGYNLSVPRRHPTITCNKEYRSILSNSKKGIKPTNFEEMQRKNWKRIQVFENNILIGEYESYRDTERSLGINRGNVYNILKGKTSKIKTHPLLTFKYKEQCE